MTYVEIGIVVWVLFLLWNGRPSRSEERLTNVYRDHFTPEQLERIGRNKDGTRKDRGW